MLLTVVSLCCGPGGWQCGPSLPKMLQTLDSTENKLLMRPLKTFIQTNELVKV